MADRISEIVALQNEAVIPSAQASVKKWAEAKLIWEEHQAKSFPVISEELKTAGGKGSSLGYLSRMERCWRMVKDFGMPLEALAPFSDFYNSPEIQEGSPDRERRPPRGEREPRERPPDDIHEWTMGIARYTSKMNSRPKQWPDLDDNERRILRHSVRDIELVLRETYP